MPVACLPCNGNALFGGHQTALSHAKGSGQISQVQDLPIRLVSTGRDGQQIWVVTEPQLIRVNAQGIVVNAPFARKRVTAVAAVFE